VTARSEVPSSFRSSSVRPGPLALVRLGITETLSRRRLIAYLVRADLKKHGADTLLGNVWWVIDPLLQMLVYWLLVGVILQRGGANAAFPLFIFAAILPWKWFDSTIRAGVTAVVGQERLIKQIYFPKLVLPIAASMSGIVNFAFGLIPLVGMMLLLYADRITPWLLLIPVIAAVQLLFTTGFTVLVSAVNVFYRDIGNLARHVLRFWFYLSPALYGTDQVKSIAKQHEAVGLWFKLNPWTYLFDSYRDVIYEGRAPEWPGLLVIALGSIAFLAFAVWFFKRVEPSFAKVL
jgi:lipopolysaccharide transport system permease protein/teichoic acid transport system permease protein